MAIDIEDVKKNYTIWATLYYSERCRTDMDSSSDFLTHMTYFKIWLKHHNPQLIYHFNYTNFILQLNKCTFYNLSDPTSVENNVNKIVQVIHEELENAYNFNPRDELVKEIKQKLSTYMNVTTNKERTNAVTKLLTMCEQSESINDILQQLKIVGNEAQDHHITTSGFKILGVLVNPTSSLFKIAKELIDKYNHYVELSNNNSVHSEQPNRALPGIQ